MYKRGPQSLEEFSTIDLHCRVKSMWIGFYGRTKSSITFSMESESVLYMYS